MNNAVYIIYYYELQQIHNKQTTKVTLNFKNHGKRKKCNYIMFNSVNLKTNLFLYYAMYVYISLIDFFFLTILIL